MNPRHHRNLRFRQQGFSLVGILVGMTVSLMLLAGVFQIFTNSKQGYRIQTALARLQENGRFAINFIRRDIRGAGYFGCAGDATRLVNTLNNPGKYAWDFSTPLQGFEATSDTTWAPALDASLKDTKKPIPLGGTDVITLRHAEGNPVKVVHHPGGKPPVSATIHVELTGNLDAGDIAIVSDCTSAAIFQITNSNQNGKDPNVLNLVHNTGNTVNPGNNTKELGKNYTGSGSVTKIATTTYYIRADSEGRPSLYRVQGTGNIDELIEGVEDMQILYGEDTDGDRKANLYATADKVTNWDNVTSVRISLLLRTLKDNLASSPHSYTFNGVTTTPKDRRLRRVFTTTVSLRN